MSNWRLVERNWINFDTLSEIWIHALSTGQFIIKTANKEDERYELFDEVFETRAKAFQFLKNFMKNNGDQ